MAEAIVRTFEERRRADSDLSDDAMNRKLEELRALLSKLDILGPGLSHLSVEAEYNFVMRNAPFLITDQQIRRRRMEAINRYLDAYQQVAQWGEAVTNIAQMVRGAPLPEPPLTSAPPLCGERAVDLQGALALFNSVRTTDGATAQWLTSIKEAPLAGDFDARIRRGVNAASIDMALADMRRAIATACRDQPGQPTWFSRSGFDATIADANAAYDDARKGRDARIDVFTAFYNAIRALQPQIALDPEAPTQAQTVNASVQNAQGAPPDAAQWVWTVTDSDDFDREVGSFEGTAVSFVAPYRGNYELKAALTLDGVAVLTVQKDFAVAGAPRLNVALAPLDPAPRAPVSAEARFASPPSAAGAIAYEWSCDVCAVTAQTGAKATFEAPDQGAASVRVEARTGPQRSLLASGCATFRVTTPDQGAANNLIDPLTHNNGPEGNSTNGANGPTTNPSTNSGANKGPINTTAPTLTPTPNAPVIPFGDANASSVVDWTTDKWIDGLLGETLRSGDRAGAERLQRRPRLSRRRRSPTWTSACAQSGSTPRTR